MKWMGGAVGLLTNGSVPGVSLCVVDLPTKWSRKLVPPGTSANEILHFGIVVNKYGTAGRKE